MNLYMGYDGQVGPEEGAALIFATTVKEAKKFFWQACSGMIVDTFVDARVTRLRGKDWLYDEANQAKLLGSTPHVIDCPRSCQSCGSWGQSPIGEDDYCDSCRGPVKEADAN